MAQIPIPPIQANPSAIEESRKFDVEVSALFRRAFSLPSEAMIQVSTFGRAIATTHADADLSFTIATVQRAQDSLCLLEPWEPPMAKRVIQGKPYRAAARLCQSGEVVPEELRYRRLDPVRDLRTANLLGFCMGVVKGDDATITWDSEGMEKAHV